MTNQTQITATEARFPLASLSLSPMNPRQTVTEGEIIELAESIWTAGLIQSIAGLTDDNGGAEIVAGGRRLRALQHLAEKHPNLASIRPELATPLVMIAPDVETAQTWATAENISRKDLSPADEIRAYGAMDKAGAPVSGIARAFAVTEGHVYKRLKLASLPEQVIDALAAKDINLGEAAAFTTCDDTDLIMDVLEQARKGYLSEYQIKNMLKPDAVSATDRRAVYVGLDAYKAAGGRVSGDLFAEKTLLDDEAILDQCFDDKLAVAARTIRQEQGWKWAEVVNDSHFGGYDIDQMKCARIYAEPGDLTEEQATRYDELAELANGDVLDDAGTVELQMLQGILDGAGQFERIKAGLISFLEECAVSCESWEKFTDSFLGVGQVRLMTIHKSKGLEAHTIVFLSLQDDSFYYQANVDEEKLAFFVAVSRAEERVFFTKTQGAVSLIAPLYELLIGANVPVLEGFPASVA